MPWPTFHITISGNVVAAYAAILFTITGAAQLWNYNRDRARIKVSAQNDMVFFGDLHYKSSQKLCIVTVANHGRRPVTITSVGGYREIPLHPFVVVECRPNLPHELTEGKSLIGILPSTEMDVSKVLWWSASDGVGNQYYSKGGGWYARRKHWRDVKKHEKKD
jgi:hypothetical protein